MKVMSIVTIIIACLLLSTEINAHCCWKKKNPGYFDLRVEIKNTGAENCHLLKSDIQQGALYGSSFPILLPASGEPFYFTLSGAVTESSLTYGCGENKKITLEMKQYVKNKHKHTSIETKVTNDIDVFEKHNVTTSSLGCCSSHEVFGIVSWELNN
jgi:hypothetical protein